MKVLIVEDDESSLVLLNNILKASGYEVECAENGKHALNIAANFHPDLIISDILMPEMDGFALCRALRSDKSLGSTPFIFYTATYTDTRDEKYAMSLGASRFLIKPMEISELLAEIKLVLEENEKSEIFSQRVYKEEYELERGHSEALRRKLDKKIKDLEKERNNLAKAKREWERTFQAIDDSIIILDLQMRVVRCNRATGTFVNSDSETLVGKYCYDLFHNETGPCKGCPVVETIHDLRPHSAEVEHKKINKVCLVSSYPIFDDDGQLINIVNSAKDVTEIKSLEKQLQQSQKMEAIGTLAGGIAHDFNNILSGIFGYSELALLHLNNPVRAEKDIDQIIKGAQKAANIVQQILSLSRQSKHDKQPLEIYIVVNETLKLLRASIPTTIEIKENIASKAMIMADPTNIQQVVMNLCTNAYHAMRETGGILSVVLEETGVLEKDSIPGVTIIPGKYLRLDIGDTGRGMDSEILNKIFEPYFTTKDVGKGTGLGLAIVLGIVQDHKGYIKVISEPGRGSEFQIYFPVLEKEALPHTPEKEEKPFTGGTERIMVVDDEKSIVKATKEYFEDHGYQVIPFQDGLQALKEFEKNPYGFDLILSDTTMPGMTGDKLSINILKIRPDLPIILCSGYSEKNSKDNALKLGIRKFVEKPVNLKKLMVLVRKILDEN